MREELEQARRAEQIAAVTAFFFVGQEPEVIASALAELMSRFLCNHKIPDDLAHQERLRETILQEWCGVVWKLVAVVDGRGETKQ